MRPEDRIVVAQLVCAAGIAWPGRTRWDLPDVLVAAGTAATTAGTVLAALGAAPHGSRLTPRVEPHDDAALLTTGPYAISRHPIYAGLLLAGAGVAVLRRRPEPLVAWAALAAVLDRKTRREEERLLARFGPDYAAYRSRVPRFLGRTG
jgi:protein-S-isoprenylcysteine O-methyltransferase Ste14